MATITVDPNALNQTMQGWQCTAQAGHDSSISGPGDTTPTIEYPSSSFPNFKDELLTAMLDLGLSAVRLEFNLADINATGFDVLAANSAIQPSTAAGNQWHYDRIDRAMDAWVSEYRTLLAAQGEQLHISICIVDFKSAGYHAEDTPSEYSLVINNVVDHFYDTYGYRPDAIEAILEPDTAQNANWTASKVANNIVQARTDLIANGHTGIEWVAPSLTQGPNASGYWDAMQTANSNVTAAVSLISYHLYVNMDTGQRNTLRTNAETDNKSPAMLEYGGATYLDLHQDLVEARCAMWAQYTALFYDEGGTYDNGYQYFLLDASDWSVSMGNRTKYFKPYFHAVRRGSIRKGASASGTGASNAAPLYFVNPNDSEVVVVKCAAAVDIALAGLQNEGATMKVRYTQGNGTSTPTAEWQPLSDVTVSGGATASRSMPGAGIIVFYNEGFLDPPPPASPPPLYIGGGPLLVGGTRLVF